MPTPSSTPPKSTSPQESPTFTEYQGPQDESAMRAQRKFSLFPLPRFSLVLLLLWLLLENSLHPRMILLGAALATLIPWYTAAFLPLAPRVHSWRAALRFMPVFLWDIVAANFQVAAIILRFHRPPASTWLRIPLDIRNPYGVVTLANVISLTPGTVSSRLSQDRTELLVHALEPGDPANAIATIKHRYERPLMEVFGP